MPLKQILWETDACDLRISDPEWWLTGTAYNENGDLVTIQYRIPDDLRKRSIAAQRLIGGLDIVPPDDQIIRV